MNPVQRKRIGHVGLLAAAAALCLAFAPAAASALEVEPSSGLSATASTTVAVSGSGFATEEEYAVGVCSAETYGPWGVPACGTLKTVSSNGAGEISTSIGVEKTNANVHAGIPFPFNLEQPEQFICAGTEPGEDVCEVVVATHGGAPEIVDGAEVSFLDFP